MQKKRKSILGSLGLGLLADVLLLAGALLLVSVFSFVSFSGAYLAAAILLSSGILAFVLYKRLWKRAR